MHALSKKSAARVMGCVFNGLIYGVHTLDFNRGWDHTPDTMHIGCLRQARGITRTCAP